MRGGALILTLALVGARAGAETGAVQLTTREALRGWEPVGRITVEGGNFCTGTLIAADLVVTTASCVIGDDGQPVEAGKISFQAGLIEGVPLAQSAVTRTIVPEGYVPTRPIPTEMLLRDVALVELATPVPATLITPYSLALPAGDAGLVTVYYAEGRIEAPWLRDDCALRAWQEGLVAMDCGTLEMGTGSPMLAASGYRRQLVALVTANSTAAGRPVTVGPGLPEVVASLKEALRRGEATSSVAAPLPEVKTKRITVGGGDDVGTGAKFVTP